MMFRQDRLPDLVGPESDQMMRGSLSRRMDVTKFDVFNNQLAQHTFLMILQLLKAGKSEVNKWGRNKSCDHCPSDYVMTICTLGVGGRS
jgi:hypothetical protein